MRFHPKNELPTEEDQLGEIRFAGRIADLMLIEGNKRWAGTK